VILVKRLPARVVEAMIWKSYYLLQQFHPIPAPGTAKHAAGVMNGATARPVTPGVVPNRKKLWELKG